MKVQNKIDFLLARVLLDVESVETFVRLLFVLRRAKISTFRSSDPSILIDVTPGEYVMDKTSHLLFNSDGFSDYKLVVDAEVVPKLLYEAP